jgi:predicted metal-dependent hydrolase
MWGASKPEKPSREARVIDVRGQNVAYTLKRFRGRSSVGLIVDHRGLTVTAPRRASDRFIVDAIREQSAWVLQKLEEWRAKTPAALRWRDGVVVPYLGEPVIVSRDLFHHGAPQLDQGYLRLATVDDGAHMQRQVVAWYRAQAAAHLPARVADFSARFDLPRAKVMVSSAQTRWGSCNVKREVRFSWRLMKAPPRVIDYVVAHELAHLRHMDHSARFWALVGQMYPQYKSAQKLLRANDALYRVF